jgi:hypothetical protein
MGVPCSKSKSGRQVRQTVVKGFERVEGNSVRCVVCFQILSKKEIKIHNQNCISQEVLANNEKLAIARDRVQLPKEFVNKLQLKALVYVQQESEKKSRNAYKKLTQKFKKIHRTESELEKTLTYIRNNAQIIIHFHPEKVMHLFAKDTHYRNQFETKTSSGSLSRPSRIKWEDNCFGKIYHNASDFDRVKYGVLNVVNDPNGVKRCLSYGDSYLALNSETVSLRTTFASGDTSSIVEVASCEHYAHVLNTYSDHELEDVVSVALGETVCKDSQRINVYKEVQIHGPVLFNRDVVAIVLNQKYQNNASIVQAAEEFAKINDVNLVWMTTASATPKP